MVAVISFRFQDASADLTLWRDGTATLSSLYSKVPQRGQASALMRHILAYADERGLKVLLTARRFKNPRGLSNDQLVEFYKKFGFVTVSQNSDLTGTEMRREPYSQELQAP